MPRRRTPHEAGFAAALLDAARPLPAGVVAHSGEAPAKRFAVYRNNVVVSLVEAMRVRFPVVDQLVGNAFFAAMARVFVTEHPPRSPLMMLYGDELPHFLEHFAPAAELPYLADVARLEAARTRAYHAADAEAIDPARLAGLDPELIAELRLILHPSAEVVCSVHPIVTIWAMHAGERALAPIADWRAEDALVARPRLTVEVCALPPGGAAFVRALAGGAALGAAASAALTASPRFDLAANLSALIGRGLVTDIAMPFKSLP